MDLQAGEGAGERSLAIVQLHRGAGAGRQRFLQRLIQRDVNAHSLGVAHPAGGLFRLRQLTVNRLLPRQNPGIAAGDMRREDFPGRASKTTAASVFTAVWRRLFSRKSATISVLLLTSASTAVAAVA